MEKSARTVWAVECLVNLITTHCSGERHKAARQSFRQADQIGNDCRMIAGKHPAGSAKSGEHFIHDEQNIVASAQFTESFETFHGIDPHARRALNQRLHDHCGDLVTLFSKNPLEFVCVRDAQNRQS